MARYNDDQQEIDNMSMMNGTYSRNVDDLNIRESNLKTAISMLSQQITNLSRTAGSMAKSVAQASDISVDKAGFAGRMAAQLGGPVGVVISNAIMKSGITERLSDGLKNGLGGVISRFRNRNQDFNNGGFLNPASMSSISSRSTGILVKEIEQNVSKPLITANRISTDQLNETIKGNKAIISALHGVEDALDGRDNKVTGKRRSDYGGSHNRSVNASHRISEPQSNVVNNYYSNNSNGSSFDTESIVEAISGLSSKFDELSDPNSGSLFSNLASKLPGGAIASLAINLATFRLRKAFQGKYVGDIDRDKNPLVTIASAAIKQYEWTRLYGELTKEQLNELIKLNGGNQKRIVGRNGWLKDWMLNNPEDFNARKKELEEKGGLGWVASKLLGGYQWFGQWDEEQWGNEIYAQADKLKRSKNPFSGVFSGPNSAWKFYNADNGERYDSTNRRRDLELERRSLYNWDWNENHEKKEYKKRQKNLREEKQKIQQQEEQDSKSSPDVNINDSSIGAVPVTITGKVISWFRRRLTELGIPVRATYDPITASLAIQAEQLESNENEISEQKKSSNSIESAINGMSDSINEQTNQAKEIHIEETKDKESKIDGGKTLEEQQLAISEAYYKELKTGNEEAKNFYKKLGNGLIGAGKGTFFGSLGVLGSLLQGTWGLTKFAASIAGPIAAVYGIYKATKGIADWLGADSEGNPDPNSYAANHKATTYGNIFSTMSGPAQLLRKIPLINKLPGSKLAGRILKPAAAISHGIDAYNRFEKGQNRRAATQALNTIFDFVPGVGWLVSTYNGLGVTAGDYVEKFTGSQQLGDAASGLMTRYGTPKALYYSGLGINKAIHYSGKSLSPIGNLVGKSGNILRTAQNGLTHIPLAGKYVAAPFKTGADSLINSAYSLKEFGAKTAAKESQYATKLAKTGAKLGKVGGKFVAGIGGVLYGAEAVSRYKEGDTSGAVIAGAAAVVTPWTPLIGALIFELALGINDLIKANIAVQQVKDNAELTDAIGDYEYLKFNAPFVRSVLLEQDSDAPEKSKKIADNYRNWKRQTGKASIAVRSAAALGDKEFMKNHKDEIQSITKSIKESDAIPQEQKNNVILSQISALHAKEKELQVSNAFNKEELKQKALSGLGNNNVISSAYKSDQSSFLGFDTSTDVVDRDSTIGALLAKYNAGYMTPEYFKEIVQEAKKDPKYADNIFKRRLHLNDSQLQEFYKDFAKIQVNQELKQIGPTVTRAKIEAASIPNDFKIKESNPISALGTFTPNSTLSEITTQYANAATQRQQEQNIIKAAEAQKQEQLKKAEEEKKKAEEERWNSIKSSAEPIVAAQISGANQITEGLKSLSANSESYLKQIEANQQAFIKNQAKLYGTGTKPIADAFEKSTNKMTNTVTNVNRQSTKAIISNNNRVVSMPSSNGDLWYEMCAGTRGTVLTA